MAIVNNRIIEDGTPIGVSTFKFMNVAKRADGKYYWQDLIYAKSLNIKSKNKPYEYSSDELELIGTQVLGKKTRLSERQKASINYGHTLVRYTNALEAIRGVASGTNFPYNKPQSWGRPADLWGYDKLAGDWFSLFTQVGNVSVNSATTITLENISTIFSFGGIKDAGLDINNSNFGFLMWNSSFTSTQAQVYFYSLTDIRDATKSISAILNGSESASLPTTNIGQGTWYMYPCITNAQFSQYSMTLIREENENVGDWFPFPFCNIWTLKVVAAGSGEDVIVGNISFDGADYELITIDSINMVYALRHLMLSFSNTANTSYVVNYNVRIKDAYNVTQPNFEGTFTIGAGSEDAPSYVDIMLFEAKDDNDDSIYRFQVGELPIILTGSYSIQTESGTQREIINIELA